MDPFNSSYSAGNLWESIEDKLYAIEDDLIEKETLLVEDITQRMVNMPFCSNLESSHIQCALNTIKAIGLGALLYATPLSVEVAGLSVAVAIAYSWNDWYKSGSKRVHLCHGLAIEQLAIAARTVYQATQGASLKLSALRVAVHLVATVFFINAAHTCS